MTFKYATKFQRFVTFLVDYILLAILAGYIASYVENLFGYDSTLTNTYKDLFTTEFNNYLNGGGSLDSLTYYAQKYYVYNLIDRCFSGGIMLALIAIFLIVVPCLWNGKTIGRSLTHLVLVDNHGQNATTKNFILRELVGTFLLYTLFGSVILFISLIFILVKSRSLVDYVSGTHLVIDPAYLGNSNDGYYRPNDNTEKYDERDNNSVEPDWKDVPQENNNDSYESNDDGDDYKII